MPGSGPIDPDKILITFDDERVLVRYADLDKGRETLLRLPSGRLALVVYDSGVVEEARIVEPVVAEAAEAA